jgi:hypothetical protein
MIAFTGLGKWGALGNQMFQYAFLRSAARQLGAPFYCPMWEGDTIFELDDASERSNHRVLSLTTYRSPVGENGWIDDWSPQDHVDYAGYFQSPRYFASDDGVRKWFSFRPDVVQQATHWLDRVEFSNAIGMHVRLGDYRGLPNFYMPRASYYTRALAALRREASTEIVVFSDQPAAAKTLLGGLAAPMTFIQGNSAAVDLFLMSRCSAFVVAASTFSWWGAFLGNGKVVCPRQGLSRPGADFRANECWPTAWIQLDAGLQWYDHYRVRLTGSNIKKWFRHVVQR